MPRLLALRFEGIEPLGICFAYKGDELVLLWKGLWEGRAWLSIGFEGRFVSLEELDQMWDDYFEACSK